MPDDPLPAMRIRVRRRRDHGLAGPPPVSLVSRKDDLMIHPPGDEILEQLWYAKEEGRTVAGIGDLKLDGESESATGDLVAQKLIRAGEVIELLPEGAERARAIVRRHRLAEILFAHVLEVDANDAESSACEFEHMLSERVVDRVCTFLGHPPSCPHGKPIPQGSCCRLYTRKVEPLITRLVDLPLGSTGTVVFIAPRSVQRLNRLAAFGVVPGSEVRLIERRPSVVLACGQTSIAIEDEIGCEIYVRPVA
jgi:DtxR family Mn-dependent transcriptional regulator